MVSRAKLLSPAEVASILGVTRVRVHQLRREGKLRPAYAGPSICLFAPAEVERHARERRGPGRPKKILAAGA